MVCKEGVLGAKIGTQNGGVVGPNTCQQLMMLTQYVGPQH